MKTQLRHWSYDMIDYAHLHVAHDHVDTIYGQKQLNWITSNNCVYSSLLITS